MMFIFSNLATSLDGKIATASRVFYPLGTPKDRKLMQVLRKQSDVVLFGASTLRSFRRPCVVTGPAAKKINQQPANAVLSSSLEGLSPAWPFFKYEGGGFRRLLFVGPQAKAKTLARFEAGAEIIQLKSPTRAHSTASQIVRELEARGYRRLLVEGGGNVMWDFVKENLIDEYHVTLTPHLIGGAEAPTLVDGKGFEPKDVLNLKLSECRKVGDELYLVYKKRAKRG